MKREVKFKQELVDNNIILSVRHLKQFFPLGDVYNKAVHDVSFDVKKGECVGLVGESGCGKTTTGRSIIRLYDITSGSIYFNGYRISAGNRWNRKEIKWTKIRTKEKIKKLKKEMHDEIKEINDPSRDENEEIINNITAQYQHQIDELNKHCAEVVRTQKEKIKQIKFDNKNGDEKIAALNLAKFKTAHANELAIHKLKKEQYEQALKNLKNEKKQKLQELKEIAQKENRPYEELVDKYEKEYNEKLRQVEQSKLLTKEENEKYQNLRRELYRIGHDRLTSKIQMIFQDPIDSLDPRMTVQDIIQEGLIIQGYKNKAENTKIVCEMLEKVGLLPEHASRYPHEFSGGQRQRIGIARALVMKPELLICDEPISALDVSIRAQVINLLNELKQEFGLTLLFIAHDLSVVKYFCDRIAVMYFGEIVEMASSDELFNHPLHPYTKALLSAIPKPNPLTEKNRQRITYNPVTAHDYSEELPKLKEILPGHFILANSKEFAAYQEEIKKLDNEKKTTTRKKVASKTTKKTTTKKSSEKNDDKSKVTKKPTTRRKKEVKQGNE